jgi:Subtilase family
MMAGDVESTQLDWLETQASKTEREGIFPDRPLRSRESSEQSNVPKGAFVRPPPKDSVIVAVIDDGIAVANQRFRDGMDGTRIAWFFDMNQGGRTWGQSEIEDLLGSFGDDEDRLYRAMGMIDPRSERRQPLRFRWTHGTHVLDLAAGYGPDEREEASRRPILAVQLPSEVVTDRSGSLMPETLSKALDWIHEKACALSDQVNGRHGHRLPMVVNFSFGIFAGPHDGYGPVERCIEDFLEKYRSAPGQPRCEVVLAAGNGFQAQAVARIDAPARDDKAVLSWRVLPDDRTSSFVHIWLPEGDRGQQQVEVRLLPPRGAAATSAPRSQLGPVPSDWKVRGSVLARAYHQLDRNRKVPRERITLVIRPTAVDAAADPVCPAGLWQIEITNRKLEPGQPIDVRVQRDDPLVIGRPRGRQAYFEDLGYERFEPDTGRLRNDERHDPGPVIRSRTLSAYTTNSSSVVVAGYRRSDGEPAIYSSAGPTTSGRIGPDLAAPCEESPSHRGVLAAGTYSGSVATLNGTSVAAPQVTRWLADEIAAGRGLSDLLERVGDGEKKGLSGPHGRYLSVQERKSRFGAGRLMREDIPPNQRRIES